MGKEPEEVKDQSQGRACLWLYDQQHERNLLAHHWQEKSKRGYRSYELDLQYESLSTACRVRYVREDKSPQK